MWNGIKYNKNLLAASILPVDLVDTFIKEGNEYAFY